MTNKEVIKLATKKTEKTENTEISDATLELIKRKEAELKKWDKGGKE